MAVSADSPVRVLFVNTRSAAGADVCVHLQLVRSFCANECRVTFATNRQARDFDRTRAALERMPGVRVVALRLGVELAGRKGYRKIPGAVANAWTLLAALVKLSWLVQRQRFEVIHSTDRPRDALLSTLLARLTRRKNVLHLHIKWESGMGRATDWAMARCDAVLAISDFVRRSLIAGGVPDSKIYTALNSTDTEEFDPAMHPPGSFRKHLGLAPDVPLLGVVARIMVWKGQLELVEALARVRDRFPDVRLAIVGKEDTWMGCGGRGYADQVKQRASELGLTDNVLWPGWFDDMASVYADLDVLCAPSREEPFGLVVTEAMAMERPVVGFAAGALPEIVRSGCEGLLVPPYDTDAMADAIMKLLEDADLRRRMGRAGRQRVLEQFTPRRQAAEVAAIYRELAGGSTRH